MKRARGSFALVLVALGFSIAPRRADAQPAPAPDGIAVGEFWFRPRFEARIRGEYYHHPVVSSGDVPVLGTLLGPAAVTQHEWAVQERTRIGLAVERGGLSGAVVVEDGRVAGYPSAAGALGDFGAATTSFHVATIEVHSPDSNPSFVRLGRQEVAWGSARLLGISDWRLSPRSLDAVRARWVARLLEIEALAALLAPPGALPPEVAAQGQPPDPSDSGTGAQLYGLDAKLHLDPLFHAEIMGIGRVVRSPTPSALVPSDIAVLDARLFGDRSGLAYSAELAYELGRYAVASGHRPVRAWAATAHVDWQSGWAWRPKFSLGGSFATGADGGSGRAMGPGATHRFDPILPDARAGLGQMGLYAWSNIAEAGFTAAMSPLDDVDLSLGFHHVRLADSRGAWFAASLLPIGQNAQNASSLLGNEIDALVSYAPLDGFVASVGYGAFVTGPGARAILSGRTDGPPRLLSATFVQVSLVAP